MPTPHEQPAPPAPAPNRLIREKSPYLLQHAHNPVDWYPWGDEARARAQAEGKPIFLSVGYATCHWCHVMERESFEDPAVAQLMNELFVNVKVDREERPDVDRVYMTFLQATTGGGGWPMSVWLTPEGKPFFAGTYFPPRSGLGRPAFADVLRELARAWGESRGALEQAAARAVSVLQGAADEAAAQQPALDPAALDRAFAAHRAAHDPRHGGFGGPPKFPLASAHAFLLRYAERTGEREAAELVLGTLRSMAAGGIHDHLGGGFHRYAVDRAWHVPHFEKMLYDQAQLATSYLEAYQVSGDAAFAETARGICDYVLGDLRDEPTGAFCAAEDADSPIAPLPPAGAGLAARREGAFYTWTQPELERVLGDAAALFCAHYGVEPQGNAEDPHGELAGQNVLHAQRPIAQTARLAGRAVDDVALALAHARARLAAHRARRPRPLRDDKIITAWNGLMIGALARAARVLDEPRYLAAAQRAAEFVTGTLYDVDADLLYRRYRAGERAFAAGLEDHAALVFGLIELYQADLALRWLELAERLADRAVRRFADRATGGFFSTAGDDPSIVLRLRDDHDGAEPSGSSLLACDLLRLAPLVGRPELAELAAAAMRSSSLGQMPQMLVALDLWTRPRPEVVICGERDDPAAQRLARATRLVFSPELSLVLADEAFRGRYGARLPHVQAMAAAPQPAAYVCEGQRCGTPITEAAELIAVLERAAPHRGATLDKFVGRSARRILASQAKTE